MKSRYVRLANRVPGKGGERSTTGNEAHSADTLQTACFHYLLDHPQLIQRRFDFAVDPLEAFRI